MRNRNLALTALAFVAAFGLAIKPIHATGQASISMSYPVANGGNFNVTLTLNTGGEAVAGADITMTLPAGVGLVSSDGSSSVLPMEVTPPGVSGQTLHFARVTNISDLNGYTGTGTLMVLTLSGTADQIIQTTLDVPPSEVLTQADSTNILSGGTFATPTPVPDATATPAPTDTATPTAAATTAATVTAKPSSTPSTLPATGTDMGSLLAYASLAVIGLSAFQLVSKVRPR